MSGWGLKKQILHHEIIDKPRMIILKIFWIYCWIPNSRSWNTDFVLIFINFLRILRVSCSCWSQFDKIYVLGKILSVTPQRKISFIPLRKFSLYTYLTIQNFSKDFSLKLGFMTHASKSFQDSSFWLPSTVSSSKMPWNPFFLLTSLELFWVGSYPFTR